MDIESMVTNMEALEFRVSQLEKTVTALSERLSFLRMHVSDAEETDIMLRALEYLAHEDAKLKKGL